MTEMTKAGIAIAIIIKILSKKEEKLLLQYGISNVGMMTCLILVVLDLLVELLQYHSRNLTKLD